MKTRIHLSRSEVFKDVLKDHFPQNELLFGNHDLIRFEKSLKSYLSSTAYVAALNSGTAAIHLALMLANVKQDDEVICQTFTFSASANPIKYQGANPIFIDSERDTWNMCPVYLEKAILDRISKGKKPKAIIVVHIYGMPAKMDEIIDIANKYQITLIEDAAEALGSEYKGRKCGTFGDFGILSFNNNKIITAFGGGALVCKTIENKERAIFIATQARDDKVYYEHSFIGYNYRMSDVLASLGSNQLSILNESVNLRRANQQFYKKLFEGVNGITVFEEPSENYFSNHWLSCVLIDEKITGFTRGDLRLQLEKYNIESRPLWNPMHLQPVFQYCDYYGGSVAEYLFKNGLCLPSSSNLTDDDRSRISESIKKLL
jgi:dTDP-4-amino-4,6-dideoxygalactose transaminase